MVKTHGERSCKRLCLYVTLIEVALELVLACETGDALQVPVEEIEFLRNLLLQGSFGLSRLFHFDDKLAQFC